MLDVGTKPAGKQQDERANMPKLCMQPATKAATVSQCARTLFARGALKDVLFVGAAGDEAVHLDLLVLPNAVAARHRLQVVLWGQERKSRRTQKEERRKDCHVPLREPACTPVM